MDNAEIVKWLGIIIVIVMAVSMLAAAFLYAPTDTSTNTTPIETQATEFTYEANFDTTTVTVLSALRMRATTSEIDKDKIDTLVKSVKGVSKVSSRFVTGQDSKWDYFADIYLTRSADVDITAEEIISLSVFSENINEKSIVKYMTLASPGKVELKNKDLNITRDFNFDGTTLTALVDISTKPSDVISVSGTIKLRGKEVTFIELIESNNMTSAPKNYSFEANLPITKLNDNVSLEADRNFDSYFDSSVLQKELQALDTNMQVYVFPTSTTITVTSKVKFSDDLLTEIQLIDGINSVEKTSTGLTITFDLNAIDSIVTKLPTVIGKEDFTAQIIFPLSKIVAQTTTANVSKMKEILAKNKFVGVFAQEAVFDVNSLLIPELGKELPLKGTLAAWVKLNHNPSDTVKLSITASVSRDTITQAFGEEK